MKPPNDHVYQLRTHAHECFICRRKMEFGEHFSIMKHGIPMHTACLELLPEEIQNTWRARFAAWLGRHSIWYVRRFGFPKWMFRFL
jgi:hypothetical protein